MRPFVCQYSSPKSEASCLRFRFSLFSSHCSIICSAVGGISERVYQVVKFHWRIAFDHFRVHKTSRMDQCAKSRPAHYLRNHRSASLLRLIALSVGKSVRYASRNAPLRGRSLQARRPPMTESSGVRAAPTDRVPLRSSRRRPMWFAATSTTQHVRSFRVAQTTHRDRARPSHHQHYTRSTAARYRKDATPDSQYCLTLRLDATRSDRQINVPGSARSSAANLQPETCARSR